MTTTDRRRLLRSVGALGLFGLTGTATSGNAAAAETELGTFAGTITDEEGDPARLVYVSLSAQFEPEEHDRYLYRTVDEDGSYEFELEPGTYSVYYEADMHEGTGTEVEIVAGETTTLDLELPATSGAVGGSVLDPNGEPVEWAQVSVDAKDWYTYTWPEDDYDFLLPLEEGEYTLEAAHDDYGTVETTVTVALGELTEVELQFSTE